MKLRKCLFAILKLWKHENICLQYMNNENMNIFAYITWIMKIFVGITLIMKEFKCLFAIHELLKYYLQYMNYENRKISALHELWKH